MTSIDPVATGRSAAERLLAGVPFKTPARLSPGLSDDEFDLIEQYLGITFADDHHAFLATVVPVGESWPDWRLGDETELRHQLTWPWRGVLFDIEHNVIWPDAWGPRPTDTADALDVARRQLAAAPQMLPVYAHRYLPAGRGSSGHPVLSMYQTDIIYYGLDLDDYIHREFELPAPAPRPPEWQPRATVAFWRDFI